FIVQAFQLIRGGADRRLQRRELQAVLPLLVGQRLLPAEVVEALLEAYRFLRVLENRLQAWNDEQTHLLPQDEPARLRLARSLDFDDWPALSAEIERHRVRVAGYFAQAVFGPVADAKESTDPALRLLDQSTPDERERAVRSLGFADPAP